MIALDLTKMQVYAKTDEGDVGQIRPGQSVDFQVDAFPKETFHGVVDQVRMNATTVQNVVTYDTIVNFDNPQMKLFPGMTAYVSIPVAAANDVVKIPNAALRYKPDLAPDKVQELYQQYGIQEPVRSGATRSSGAQAGKGTGASRESSQASDAAVVWKLLADKSLQPIPVHIGLTDHTDTAMLNGNLKPGDELITGATTTAKAGSSAPTLGGQRR